MREFYPVEKQNRIYYYKDYKIFINDILAISVSDSGTHRLNTINAKYIISPGWYYIEIIGMNSWSM